MQLGLNGATIMKADLTTDIRAAALAGFDLLEIWAAKLDAYLKSGYDLFDLKRVMIKVKPYALNSIEHITFKESVAYDAIKARTEELSRIANRLGCPHIVVVPSPRPVGVSDEEVRRESVRALRDLAAIAAPWGVKLAFEFLGFADCSVNTLAACWRIVREVNHPNVTLNIDSFHFYVGGSTLESIREVDASKIALFHINDAENRPRHELTDAHRLLPGDGVIPLRDILRELKAIGFNGPVSVELFRPEYWEWEPEKLARVAKEKTEKLVKEIWGNEGNRRKSGEMREIGGNQGK